MAHSLHNASVAITFSTKKHDPILTDEIGPKIHAYMAGLLRNLECSDVIVGHVSGCLHIPPKFTKKL